MVLKTNPPSLEKMSQTPKPPEVVVSVQIHEMAQALKDVQKVLVDVGQSTDLNSIRMERLKDALAGLPRIFENLENIMRALDARLSRPLVAQVDHLPELTVPPAPAPEPVEILPWNQLSVTVTGRNFQGNIQTLKIVRES